MTDKTILYEGEYLRLLRRKGWEYAERLNCSGVVFMIPVTPEGKLVLCEQERVPVDQAVLELPAGLVNDGAHPEEETLEEAAYRELEEETGYRAGRMTSVMTGPLAAGSSSQLATFFMAENLVKVGPGGGDASENITVHEIAPSEAETWLKRKSSEGTLIDPKIYIGLYLLQKAKLREGGSAC